MFLRRRVCFFWIMWIIIDWLIDYLSGLLSQIVIYVEFIQMKKMFFFFYLRVVAGL